MNISQNRINDVGMYCILILNIYIYLISNKQFGNITLAKYLIILIGLGYFFVFYKINKNIIKSNVILIFIVMVIQFFILPLGVFLIQGITSSIGYSFISLICICFYFVIGYFLKDSKKLEVFIKLFYFMTLIYIFIAVLQNPSSISISNIKDNLFNINERMSRQFYGFAAPNAFAILSVSNIVSAVYLAIIYKKSIMKKLLIIFTIVINIIFIITTGSRGALISLIVFFGVFFYNKFLIKRVNKVVAYIITSILVIYILNKIIYFFSLGLNYSQLSSGRLENWLNVIYRLNERKSILIGLGYVNSNTFYSSEATINLLTDNWFIHTLATQGVLGLILGISLIILILVSLYKNKEYCDKNNYMKSFMILILVYSSIENMFFNVNYILTMIFWIFIFTHLFEQLDTNKKNWRNKNE